MPSPADLSSPSLGLRLLPYLLIRHRVDILALCPEGVEDVLDELTSALGIATHTPGSRPRLVAARPDALRTVCAAVLQVASTLGVEPAAKEIEDLRELIERAG
jgi:hypothetical protein